MAPYLQSAPACLAQLSLNQTAVTEATLAVLPSCVPQLRLLSIKQTKVPVFICPDKALRFRIRCLMCVFVCQVKDVAALAQMAGLQTLSLDGTGVSEESLKSLATHPALSSLSLAGIPVTDGNATLEIISGL